MKLINFFLIFFHVLFKKEIVLLNSPLQFINFVEFISSQKNNYKFSYEYIFLGYLNNKEINIINNINKKISFNKYKIIPFKKNINIFLLHFFIKFRKFFLTKYNQIIFGDYNYYLFREFYKISNSRIMLDDGTSSLEFKKLFRIEKKNLMIYSIFDKKIYSHKKVIKNNFYYLRSFLKNIKKIKKKKLGYFLGAPFVELKILTKNQYNFYIKKVISKNKNINFVYVPHPREISTNYNKYNFKKILKSKYSFELFLIISRFYPKIIVGAYSTLFIMINMIFNAKLNIKSYPFIIQSKKKTAKYDDQYNRYKLIDRYTKKKNIYSNKIIINA